MKITETRKAIIELIEPFMNKTLSFGCYLSYGEEIHIFCLPENDRNNIISIFNDNTNWIEDIEDFKVLWHYGITAIFNFIKSKWNYTVEVYWDTIWIAWEFEYEFQNKPLHLFTEEEDKQLLEILTNLSKND